MTLERWQTFPKRIQLLNIGAEFERARVWQERRDVDEYRAALHRALLLLALTLQDARWQENLLMLKTLEGEIRAFLESPERGEVAILYRAL